MEWLPKTLRFWCLEIRLMQFSNWLTLELTTNQKRGGNDDGKGAFNNWAFTHHHTSECHLIILENPKNVCVCVFLLLLLLCKFEREQQLLNCAERLMCFLSVKVFMKHPHINTHTHAHYKVCWTQHSQNTLRPFSGEGGDDGVYEWL